MADTNTVHVGAVSAPPGASYDVRLVTVENDVRGLKSDLGEIKTEMSTGFKDLGTAISAKGQPNWHLAAIGASLVVAGVSAVWALFGGYQARTDQSIQEQKARSERFMTREDIMTMNASAKEIADLKSQIAATEAKRTAAQIVKDAGDGYATKAELEAESKAAATRSEYNRLGRLELRERVMKIESEIVGRHEHEIRNAHVDAEMGELRHKIDDLSRRDPK